MYLRRNLSKSLCKSRSFEPLDEEITASVFSSSGVYNVEKIIVIKSRPDMARRVSSALRHWWKKAIQESEKKDAFQKKRSIICQRLVPHHSGQSGRNPLIVTSISDIVQSKDLLKENRYYGELIEVERVLRLRDRQTNFQRFMVVKKAFLLPCIL